MILKNSDITDKNLQATLQAKAHMESNSYIIQYKKFHAAHLLVVLQFHLFVNLIWLINTSIQERKEDNIHCPFTMGTWKKKFFIFIPSY